jgi:aminoglycoside phosphotransferase (APT) family kinase protein
MSTNIASSFNKNRLIAALAAVPELHGIGAADLRPLTGGGLHHDHVLLGDSFWLLRIPRAAQAGMTAEEFLAFQRKCYEAASKSGHAPACLNAIAPQAGLPFGALIVQKLEGRKAEPPRDWNAMAQALAALHSLPEKIYGAAVPVADRAFASQDFLINALFKEAYGRAKLDQDSRALIDAELSQINAFLAVQSAKPHAMSLLCGDAHPGNFLIDKNGKAWMVDLEFMTGDMPHIDLADAALSLTANQEAGLRPCRSEKERRKFYKAWLDAADPQRAQNFAGIMPMAERIVRARALLGLCEWAVKTDAEKNAMPAKTRRHWDAVAALYLSPPALRSMFENDAYPAPVDLTETQCGATPRLR